MPFICVDRVSKKRVHVRDENVSKYNIKNGFINPSCPSCDTKFGIRAGEKRIKHFYHLTKSNNCIQESEEHFNAKHELANFLNQGKEIIITFKCRNCREKSEAPFKLICKQFEAQVEYIGKGYRADVAVIYNNKPILIFEVLYTHKTLENDKRPVLWVELSASDILKACLHEDSKPIKLKNLRENIFLCKFCGVDE